MDYMSHEPQLQTNTVLMVRVSSGHPDLGGGGGDITLSLFLLSAGLNVELCVRKSRTKSKSSLTNKGRKPGHRSDPDTDGGGGGCVEEGGGRRVGGWREGAVRIFPVIPCSSSSSSSSRRSRSVSPSSPSPPLLHPLGTSGPRAGL